MSNGTPLATDHSDPSHRCIECMLRGLIRRAEDQRDLNHREVIRLDTELAKTRRALALSEAKRLTLEIERAIERDDRQAWSRAVQERSSLQVTVEDIEAIQREYAKRAA
jgi:hypothetical protein